MLLPDALQSFFLHCRFEKNLSEKTLKAYRTDTNQFLAFMRLRSFDISIAAVSKTELKEYLISIGALKPKSIKRKIATLKALFNFLEFEDLLSVNPFRKMRINIKEPKLLPRVMDIREITRIFKTAYSCKKIESTPEAYSRFQAIRDMVIIELLFSTGARVSEIAALTKDNINLDTGKITIRGKGDKERAIQVCNRETIDLLKQYYRLYRQPIENAGNYFLINRLGRRLSDQSIRGIVKKLAGKAGIDRHITPHMFRHSFATLLLEKDVDIKYIQSLLGHSSIMTTQIYTHVNQAKQKHILKTKHPRKDLNMTLGIE